MARLRYVSCCTLAKLKPPDQFPRGGGSDLAPRIVGERHREGAGREDLNQIESFACAHGAPRDALGSGKEGYGALILSKTRPWARRWRRLALRLALEILQLGEHRIDVGDVFLLFRCGHGFARLLRQSGCH